MADFMRLILGRHSDQRKEDGTASATGTLFSAMERGEILQDGDGSEYE